MAAAEYIPIYHDTHGEAVRCGEIEQWERSFRENIACARDIERAVQSGAFDALTAVLEKYGFNRTAHVLANTAKQMAESVNGSVSAWEKKTFIPSDPEYDRLYSVNVSASELETLVERTQRAYQALGLFGREHCATGMYDESVLGRVLVMKPETLKENYWSPQNQLWLAEDGFGCDPKASGRAIYAVCLGDGEQARWNREDFAGVLDEQYLPDWAKEKLAALRAPDQKESAGPVMGGIS